MKRKKTKYVEKLNTQKSAENSVSETSANVPRSTQNSGDSV